MDKIKLYHGSPNPKLIPAFGKGEEKHDYGRGLYFTQDIELAREWAVCNENDGYLYEVEMDIDGLKMLDFDEHSPLSWIAELMSHRDADDSVRYKRFAPAFIEKYKMDISEYDIIKGWRADSSFFLIAKRFVRDELDAGLLSEALRLGNLGIQYCVKSEKAFERINKAYDPIERVSMDIYLEKYNERDNIARKNLYDLLYSEKNTLKDTFGKYL